ncbi:NUDIX domain-containing protein [Streptomyces kaniharaensis]|uniref:NUDIX domain-containing protein n=1 Tax=Streptomyces kaniharaensis TaxID=212423 RepID=A0A6N7L1N7_9ACTN|nr:NUDIX domain-containing protein [Streptomyces kaniharaensis]
MPHPLVVGVHLVLIENGRVLLGQRANTTFAAQHWHAPAGHLEEGESVLAGMVREADEELGITSTRWHGTRWAPAITSSSKASCTPITTARCSRAWWATIAVSPAATTSTCTASATFCPAGSRPSSAATAPCATRSTASCARPRSRSCPRATRRSAGTRPSPPLHLRPQPSTRSL